MYDLATIEDFETALQRSEDEPVLIYKHSSICALSFRARWHVKSIDDGDVPVFEVVVQRSRDVSNEIEARLGVRHETPQLLLVKDRTVLYHDSHTAITKKAIRRQLEAQQPK